MAYLFQANSVLGRILGQSTIGFYPPNTTNLEYATVAFLPTSVGTLNMPSSVLCPNTKYFLRVFFPNDDLEVRFLGTDGTTGNYILVGPNDNASMVTFIPENGPNGQIGLRVPFSGQLINPGKTPVTHMYSLLTSPLYGLVGYSSPLPALLSNCNMCGCPSGKKCGANGICSQSSANLCTGICGGRCYGTCPNGSKCTGNALIRPDGTQGPIRYSCVSNSVQWWWIIIGIALVIGFLLLLFFVLKRDNDEEPKETKIIKETTTTTTQPTPAVSTLTAVV